MKTKLLTAAIAAASVMASGMAVADGHSNAVTSALAHGKISGEVYAGYAKEGLEASSGGSSADTDNSDFDLDSLRLGYNTNVRQDVELGVELEWDLGDGFGSNGNTQINDLFLAKSMGNTTVTGGRFKQIVNRDNAVERSDAVFTESASITGNLSGLLGAIGLTPAEQADIQDALDTADSVLGGAARRIDGVEVKSFNDAGLNGSVSLYKGGVDSTGGDSDRNFGIAGSIGWQGGNDDARFGGTLAIFQQDDDEMDNTAAPGEITSLETSGYSLTLNGATGPLVGTLTYSDSEIETDIDGANSDDSELDGIGVWGAFNISGAQRSFDQYGVLQGPKLGKNEMGYEVGINYTATDLEEGGFKADLDSMGLAFNAYCGPNKKFYLSWSDQELDLGGGDSIEADQIALGMRLDF